ncbi:RusA family crossover junction endodeoxyribonuclease [Saccharicrinis sp. GN24d3]|uniref:RusA family crossover junction endodeoxyribonuclease n=1 Tax=Saccharicrinis sp. GN24d3 TaxID=3458416 RepID=UPI004036BB2D
MKDRIPISFTRNNNQSSQESDLENSPRKPVTFVQNSNIDYLFGFIGGEPVPTKQDAYKPINVVEIDELGGETILNDFYRRKPETDSVKRFKEFIKVVAKNVIKEKIPMPNKVQVHLSISIKEKRFFEVDVDNLAKTVLDSLNNVAFDDDSQVTSLIVEKDIHPMKINKILIAITELTPERHGLVYRYKEE